MARPAQPKKQTEYPCPACYRPGTARGYCDRCTTSGAAARHQASATSTPTWAPERPAPAKRAAARALPRPAKSRRQKPAQAAAKVAKQSTPNPA